MRRGEPVGETEGGMTHGAGDGPHEQVSNPEKLRTLQDRAADIKMALSHLGQFTEAEIAEIVQRFIKRRDPRP